MSNEGIRKTVQGLRNMGQESEILKKAAIPKFPSFMEPLRDAPLIKRPSQEEAADNHQDPHALDAHSAEDQDSAVQEREGAK